MQEGKKLKVLLITNLFPNNMEPNRGIFVKQEAMELAKLCDLKVVAPVPWFPFNLKFCPKWSLNSLICHHEEISKIVTFHPRWFIIPKILPSIYGFLLFLSLLLNMRKIKKDFDFDAIYGQWIYPDGFASVLLAKLYKKPVILHALGCDINLYSKFVIRRALIRWSINNSFKVISVSEALKNMIISLGIDPGKVVVVPNGVDTNLFKRMDQNECRIKLSLPVHGKIILFIGSLEEVKGVAYLLEAFDKLQRVRENKVYLVMIGKGSLESRIKEQIRLSKMGERVVFAGEVAHENIPIWFNASDIFCLPSIREGMPNVILEAIACGKYIVSTNVGGIPELIKNDKTGILIPPHDSEALKDAILKGLENDSMNVQRGQAVISWQDNAEMVHREMVHSLRCGENL